MNVTYDYYRVFYYVARCGSFTRAAQALLSNQPNVSKAIRNLENQLGCACQAWVCVPRRSPIQGYCVSSRRVCAPWARAANCRPPTSSS